MSVNDTLNIIEHGTRAFTLSTRVLIAAARADIERLAANRGVYSRIDGQFTFDPRHVKAADGSVDKLFENALTKSPKYGAGFERRRVYADRDTLKACLEELRRQ